MVVCPFHCFKPSSTYVVFAALVQPLHLELYFKAKPKMFMYHRAPRQAGAQETRVKTTRACERPSSRVDGSTPQSPLPAGGAQVCPADDAVLMGRVEPLESRQRPLLNAKAAFPHVPKNNIKRD